MTMTVAETKSSRREIYYWKCDRSAALYGTSVGRSAAELQQELRSALSDSLKEPLSALYPAGGQGNHITYRATIGDTRAFVRVEDGPECDDYLDVESHVLDAIRSLGLPAPRVLAADASRERVPFAWQVLEEIPHSDLNDLQKRGRLDPKELGALAEHIGAAVAGWQGIETSGFGPFDTRILRREKRLQGYHRKYSDYFHLQLKRHLYFLIGSNFLSTAQATEIAAEIKRHEDLLALKQGCLVHKDLALWNILGTATEIAAFIDWDDAISGDAMDDLSLLGCFHDGAIIRRALWGYASVRPLPDQYRLRFWLHLLRNMIVKAVIRVGAGYFERTDECYLIGTGGTGADLKKFTQARIMSALSGLRGELPIELL